MPLRPDALISAEIRTLPAATRGDELGIQNYPFARSPRPPPSKLNRTCELTELYLYESTRIVDGDLEPLLELRRLRDFRMMNRKHYLPSVSEIIDRLGLKA
jgi:hypothetical protein